MESIAEFRLAWVFEREEPALEHRKISTRNGFKAIRTANENGLQSQNAKTARWDTSIPRQRSVRWRRRVQAASRSSKRDRINPVTPARAVQGGAGQKWALELCKRIMRYNLTSTEDDRYQMFQHPMKMAQWGIWRESSASNWGGQ